MEPLKKRLFIGIKIPEAFHDDFHQGEFLFRLLPKIRWIPKENLHITVEFLGNVEDREFAALEANLKEAASASTPFELHFEKICFGPRHQDEGMLWAQFQMNEDWRELVDGVRRATAFLRHQHFYKTPTPHITLARWKMPGIPQKMNLSVFQMKTTKIPINAINLYESKLLPEGSQYSILKTFALTNK